MPPGALAAASGPLSAAACSQAFATPSALQGLLPGGGAAGAHSQQAYLGYLRSMQGLAPDQAAGGLGSLAAGDAAGAGFLGASCMDFGRGVDLGAAWAA